MTISLARAPEFSTLLYPSGIKTGWNIFIDIIVGILPITSNLPLRDRPKITTGGRASPPRGDLLYNTRSRFAARAPASEQELALKQFAAKHERITLKRVNTKSLQAQGKG